MTHITFRDYKVGRVFPMVIWPEIRKWQNRDDDHREDALHCNRKVQQIRFVQYLFIYATSFVVEEFFGTRSRNGWNIIDQN